MGLMTKLVSFGVAAIVGLLLIGAFTKTDPGRERAKAQIELCFAASPEMHSTTHDEQCQVMLRAYKAKHGAYP